MSAKPSPLDEFRTPPAPFPTHVFPTQLQRYIRESAASFPCPEDFIGTGMLATAAAAIGNTREARLKRQHREPCILYLAVVARPSFKKSPVLDHVTRPVWDQEHAAHQDWIRDRDAAEDPRKAPVDRPHYAATDVTIEGLARKMEKHPRGLLFHQDEMSGWVASMDQYRSGGRGSDLQSWLKIYSGAPYSGIRSGSETVHLRRLCVSIIGGVQPAMLHKLATGQKNTIRADGFLDRLAFAYPYIDRQRISHYEVPEDVEGDWAATVRTLYRLEGAEDGQAVPLDLAPDARAVYYTWLDTLYERVTRMDTPAHMEGRIGKGEGLALRLALVLQLLTDATNHTVGERIHLPAVEGGIALVEYFLDHARRVTQVLTSTGKAGVARTVLDWMTTRNLTKVTARELVTAAVGGIQNAEHVRAIFHTLVEDEYGRSEEVKNTRGRPSLTFFLAEE